MNEKFIIYYQNKFVLLIKLYNNNSNFDIKIFLKSIKENTAVKKKK